MSLYSDPPPYRDFKYDKPTLLVCWWATSLCACVILLRVAGRFIRTERLFPEDRIAALAIIPLFLRMGCVHYIILNGTNNIQRDGMVLSENELAHIEIASGLVLLARVLYAATLWILKNTILEFFKRLTDVTWERSYQTTIIVIRYILLATFIAVIISDLTECQPFNHYWQVLPDPGGQCRQGYVQLLTMSVCNILTDLLLVFFPIPIILRSHMRIKRKVQLTLLFSLSLAVVGVTLYRVPHVIWEGGRQQYRSLLASVELLFATFASNALVLGSFVRDRGVKKQKFRRGSNVDSIDRASNRRPTLHRHWGSDEDLVRDVGMTLDPELQGHLEREVATPAGTIGEDIARWQFPQRQRSTAEASEDSLISRDPISKPESHVTPRRVSFFDVGGLLEESAGTSSGSYRRPSHASSQVDPNTQQSAQPSPPMPAEPKGALKGSNALLNDLGGMFSSRPSRSRAKNGTELQPIPQAARERQNSQTYNMHGKPNPVLRDPGGLLH